MFITALVLVLLHAESSIVADFERFIKEGDELFDIVADPFARKRPSISVSSNLPIPTTAEHGNFHGAVIGVFSMVSSDESSRAIRDSIRTTWAQRTRINNVERIAWGSSTTNYRPLRVVFVCGTRPMMMSGEEEKRKALFEESSGKAYPLPTQTWKKVLENLREEVD